MNYIDPFGLYQFQAFGQTIDIQATGSFLPINVSYDFQGNWSTSWNFPPLAVGAGLDIRINPPPKDSKYCSPYVGAGRYMTGGTNIVNNAPDATAPLDLSMQGLNISVGVNVIPFPVGVIIP